MSWLSTALIEKLAIGVRDVKQDGFQYHYRTPDRQFIGVCPTPVIGYVAIDPSMAEIHMPVDSIRLVVMNDPERPRSFRHTPISQLSMDFINTRANRSLLTIAWINEMKFGGWPARSSVWLDPSPTALCSTTQSPTSMGGAVLRVSYNWFTISQDAINIYGGYILWKASTRHQGHMFTIPNQCSRRSLK